MEKNQKQSGQSKLICIFILLTFLSIYSCSNRNNKYEIITSKESFSTLKKHSFIFQKSDTTTYKYNNLLYFKKNDSIFIIVTERLNQIKCNNLMENNVYELRLKSLRPKNMYNYHYITSYPVYNGEIVNLEKGSGIIWDLYITPYIRNLCYMKD